MTGRYENPLLYNSVNQPVDRKTGLIVQQEIPLRQLGRMTQKYDQGFLDFVADRAMAKYFQKKGKRGTAIFLPDRIRFTRKNFRKTLFYREIKVFYKSDPQTFCFVLYVIEEKSAKRRYEVYQCDNMEDIRRIEDILEISRMTTNKLLLDTDSIYQENHRRSFPAPPPSVEQLETRYGEVSPPPLARSSPPPPSQTLAYQQQQPPRSAIECPHCKRISVVAQDVSQNPSEIISVKQAPAPRSRSVYNNGAIEGEWIRINDKWRNTDYAYHNHVDPRGRPRQSRYPMVSRRWDTWVDDNEMIERRYHRRPNSPQYSNEKQVRPYHIASTYTKPAPVNRDPARQQALHDGKPMLNRGTMQIMEPYVNQPASTQMRRYRSESELMNPSHYVEKEQTRVIKAERYQPVEQPKQPPIIIAKPIQEEAVEVKKSTVQLTVNDEIIKDMFCERFAVDKRNNYPDTDSLSTLTNRGARERLMKDHAGFSKPIIEYETDPSITPRLYNGFNA
ncbi:unnamed protein product [Echinostoma caproni]|uniref:SET domain-containing protein n=1 Tax=Echinostoma caproni TaxID=27848 RepID=A0A183ADM2_9TREM|nr:unnamed protein product [Echinostoma caproni]